MDTIGFGCPCLHKGIKTKLNEALAVYIGDAENTLRRIEAGELQVGSLKNSLIDGIKREIPEYKELRRIIEDMKICEEEG